MASEGAVRIAFKGMLTRWGLLFLILFKAKPSVSGGGRKGGGVIIKKGANTMSTEQNKAISRRIIEEIWNKGDLAVVEELIAANYVFHDFVGQEIKGPEGFKQYVTMIRTVYPDFHITIEDMLAEGDKVAFRFTWRGTHKGKGGLVIAPTGKQVTVTGMAIAHIVGDKEEEVWESGDSLGMLQQMGVVPPMGQGGG